MDNVLVAQISFSIWVADDFYKFKMASNGYLISKPKKLFIYIMSRNTNKSALPTSKMATSGHLIVLFILKVAYLSLMVWNANNFQMLFFNIMFIVDFDMKLLLSVFIHSTSSLCLFHVPWSLKHFYGKNRNVSNI